MSEQWNEARIQHYIDGAIEESLTLEYKAAGALGKQAAKKDEVRKDVSAMANSAGGIIIYGVREHKDQTKRHLPEKVDPIDRTAFTREWLEQVINAIQPRIDGLVLHPVPLSSGDNDVAYVLNVPESRTAHQASDHRYYKRYNFQAVPMEDYEVRLVMNRWRTPDAEVEFGFEVGATSSDNHVYRLRVELRNHGHQVVNHLKLQFELPDIGWIVTCDPDLQRVAFKQDPGERFEVTFWLREVLFPKEELDISRAINLRYQINREVFERMQREKYAGREVALNWTLYADTMPCKQGRVPFDRLHRF